MRTWYILFIGLISAILSGCARNNPPEKPNFIIILADDLGFNDLSCYNSKFIETPNLDHMASLGLMFTDFHSNCSVCSPTRAALMTGRYQHRTGIVNVLGQTSMALPQIQGLPNDRLTIADYLKNFGYQTAIFGKWHLGNLNDYHPLDFGFDYFFGVQGGMGNPFTYLPANPGPETKSMLFRNRERVKGPGKYFTYRLADEVVDFIDNRDPKAPFFIYLPFTAPHLPLWKPDDSLTYWDGNRFGPHPDDLESAYKATIEAMDLAIGEIFQKLKNTGLDNNTLVFFTSDNGPVDVGSCKPYRGRKSNLYEGGTRVPAIAYWPEKIEPGQISGELLTTMDVFPTLVGILGNKPPEPDGFDGVDFSDVLFFNKSMPERNVFWEKPVGVDMNKFHIRREAVRKGKWKLVRERTGKTLELYDLQADTAEQNNIAEYNQERVEDLYNDFLIWRSEVYSDAPMTLEEMVKYLESY